METSRSCATSWQRLLNQDLLFSCLKGLSKPLQVLFDGIEAVIMVLIPLGCSAKGSKYPYLRFRIPKKTHFGYGFWEPETSNRSILGLSGSDRSRA